MRRHGKPWIEKTDDEVFPISLDSPSKFDEMLVALCHIFRLICFTKGQAGRISLVWTKIIELSETLICPFSGPCRCKNASGEPAFVRIYSYHQVQGCLTGSIWIGTCAIKIHRTSWLDDVSYIKSAFRILVASCPPSWLRGWQWLRWFILYYNTYS